MARETHLIATRNAVLVVGGVRERLNEVGALLEAIVERFLELRKLKLLPHVVQLLHRVIGVVEEGIGQLELAAVLGKYVQPQPCHELERSARTEGKKMGSDERFDGIGDRLIAYILLRQ